jgi:protein gp37
VSANSSIEWLLGGATWNPTRGCTPIAPECARCYARTFAERWRGIPGHPYEQGFDPRTVPDALDLPKRWRKPRTVFVNSMSDLFHVAFPDAYIMDVLSVIAAARWHRYIILTKRAARMRDFFRAHREWWGEPEHVTLGVSVGTLARRGEIDILRETPAARRMVSFEPLLEDLGNVDLRGIDLAAIGGESGPGARPCDVRWIRSLVKLCRSAGCAPFVKQLGAHVEDRNDAGFDGDETDTWPADTRVEDDPGDTGYQGAPVRVRLRDRKGADPAEWPEDLRVREMPR